MNYIQNTFDVWPPVARVTSQPPHLSLQAGENTNESSEAELVAPPTFYKPRLLINFLASYLCIFSVVLNNFSDKITRINLKK